MTEFEMAWLAGYLEGEGCFHIRSVRHRSPSVSVYTTDMDVAERAASLMGVKRSREYPRKLGHKSVYAVRVGADAAIALMQQLRPHMGARRGARIDEVLALALARPGYAFGERQGVAKLTADAVREIRSTPIRWGTQTKLARKFGVSQACIWNVVCGRSWTKVA